MNSIYTIINIFSLGEYTERDECYAVHYSKESEAKEAFRRLIILSLGLSKNAETMTINDEEVRFEDLFDELAENGYCFRPEHGNDIFFVRHQLVHETYAEEDLP